MGTLKKEKELIEKIVEKLRANVKEDVEIININDYTDERKDHMISVGINSTVPAHPENPMLPDYDHNVDILIDSFIAKDRYGEKFEKIKEAVCDYLETYLANQRKLAELFDDIPVVGMFLTNMQNATTEKSNQTVISLRVVASYPI